MDEKRFELPAAARRAETVEGVGGPVDPDALLTALAAGTYEAMAGLAVPELSLEARGYLNIYRDLRYLDIFTEPVIIDSSGTPAGALSDGAVDRFAIEATDGGNSVFQQAASKLRLGIPLDLR